MSSKARMRSDDLAVHGNMSSVPFPPLKPLCAFALRGAGTSDPPNELGQTLEKENKMTSTRFLGGVAALALGLALTVPSVSFGAEYGQRGGGGGARASAGASAPAVSGGGGARAAGGTSVNSRVSAGSSMNSYAAVRSSPAVGAPNYGRRTAGNPTWNGGRIAANPGWNGDRWNGGWYGGGPIIGGSYAYFGPDYYDYGPDYSYYDNGYYDEGTAVAVAPVAVAPVAVAPVAVAVAPGADANWCAQTYRSYDPASGTYLGFDGQRHPCP
jgi:hypothetical protein